MFTRGGLVAGGGRVLLEGVSGLETNSTGMLKSSRADKAPTRPGGKKPTDIPAENVRVLALLDQWKRRPVTQEELQAWEETRKSLDESRPHRPLFS